MKGNAKSAPRKKAEPKKKPGPPPEDPAAGKARIKLANTATKSRPAPENPNLGSRLQPAQQRGSYSKKKEH